MNEQELMKIEGIRIIDQAECTANEYVHMLLAHQKALAQIGLPASFFAALGQEAGALMKKEAEVHHLKYESLDQKDVVERVLKEALHWRKVGVIDRVKLVFENDARAVFFRSKSLRTVQVAVVIREIRLMILSLRRFKDEKVCQKVGLGADLIQEGEALLAELLLEDEKAIEAGEAFLFAKKTHKEQKLKLIRMLLDVQRRAAIELGAEEIEGSQLDLRGLREHIARLKGAIQAKKTRARNALLEETAALSDALGDNV